MTDIHRDEGDQTGGNLAVSERREDLHGASKRTIIRCSICRRRTWMNATHIEEPPGVPEPSMSWTLCKRCHAALLVEMERSPVLSPLRLRIAMGIVAADRSPDAYAPTRAPMTDHSWIVIMGWGFAIAMVLHLILIVALAYTAGH